MGYASIKDPSVHFQVASYSGNGTDDTAITNDGNSDLQPDWWWVKRRDTDASGHALYDSTRGVTKRLNTNISNAEDTQSDRIKSFDTDGFTLGDNVQSNASGSGYLAFQWKANGGTTSSNTDGSITSTVQANTDAGFSIVTFTGNNTNDATIGHGLGTTPAMILTKNRSDAVSWRVWHQDLTSTYSLFLNDTPAETAPASQGAGYIKTVGSSTYSTYQGTSDSNGVNGNSDDMISYCFAEKQGYSKFGKYTGAGLNDISGGRVRGTFVYTGFKHAFVIIKAITTSANWQMYNHKIPTYGNVIDLKLGANLSVVENGADLGTTSQNNIDFLSNGFRATTGNTDTGSTETYIYMAFAHQPFFTIYDDGSIPTTAR